MADADGVGMSVEEFEEAFRGAPPAIIWFALEGVAVRLGWKVLKTWQVIKPIIAEKETYSKSLEVMIPVGKVIGSTSIVTTQAENQEGKMIEI